jgi:hypothetical protein
MIVAAVTRLRDELILVREAFGNAASTAELTAGASALRAGATGAALSRLRVSRTGRPSRSLPPVMADLVAAGVPADTAVGAVLALASDADDTDYLTFRRNVQRDIALGASPSAALAIRIRAAVSNADGTASPGTGSTAQGAERKRKALGTHSGEGPPMARPRPYRVAPARGFPLAAQTEGSLTTGASVVRYDGFFSALPRWCSPGHSIRFPPPLARRTGKLDGVRERQRCLQGTAAASWLAGASGRWRLELSGSAGGVPVRPVGPPPRTPGRRPAACVLAPASAGRVDRR